MKQQINELDWKQKGLIKMELWIRTQDRMNLVKINQVSLNYQNNKQIIANYIP